MTVSEVIDSIRIAIADNPAIAVALFRVDGELVGTTEVDIRAGGHSFKVDEPTALISSRKIDNVTPTPTSSSLLWYAQYWAVKVPESTNNTTPSLPGP